MKDKKLLLRVAFKLMSFASLSFVFYMLLAGFFDDDNGESIVYIDLSKINSGMAGYFDVANKKLVVLYRAEAMLNSLPKQNSAYFIAYAYDPIFGCPVEFVGDHFKSVCVDIKYDLSGKVYENKRSDRNLIVPKYKFIKPNVIAIQVD